MNFSRNEQEIVDAAEEISNPSGEGKLHLICYGIIVPLVISFFAARAWITEEAIWLNLSHRGEDFDIKGEGAKVMAGAYFCGAVFLHFRSFWRMLGFEKIANAGMAIALYLGIGAMLTALGFAMAG